MSKKRNPMDAFQSISEFHAEQRGDYDAAKASRLRKRRRIAPGGAGADWHYRSPADFLKVLEYARDMDINDSIMGSMLDRSAINTIQSGMTLDYDTGDTTLDETLIGDWKDWAEKPENCDVSGENNFYDMQWLAFRATKCDGDIFAIAQEDGYLQFMEAHRPRTPTFSKKSIFQGIELGPGRRPINVWFTREDLAYDVTQTLVKDYVPIPVFDEDGVRRVFHLHTRTKKRFNQTRGISAFTPMFDMSGMHDDLQFAALLTAQVQNAVIFLTERDANAPSGPDEQLGERTQTERDDGSVETIENIGVGTNIKTKPGEKIKGFNPTTPGTQFVPHVKLVLTLMGVNLGMPLVLVLMDASETNFSGYRAAIEQAKMGFQENQRQVVGRFCNPTREWRLSRLEREDSSVKRALEKVRRTAKQTGKIWYTWHQPKWPYIQPVEDRTADMLAVANYQEAPSTNAAKNGFDYDREMQRGIEDRGKSIEWAMKEADRLNALKSADQNKVSWEQLYTPPQPKFVSLSVSESRDPAKKPGGDGTQPAAPARRPAASEETGGLRVEVT